MAYKLLPSGALADDVGSGLLPDGTRLFAAASGAVSAPGASLTGTGAVAAGAASGNGGAPAVAPGASLAGAGSVAAGLAGGDPLSAPGASLAGGGSVTAGGATGGVATGALSSDPMENNAGSLLANVPVVWTWWLGPGIGANPTLLTHGAGTTNAGGVLALSGLPAGAGILLVRTDDGSGVFYQPAVVA